MTCKLLALALMETKISLYSSQCSYSCIHNNHWYCINWKQCCFQSLTKTHRWIHKHNHKLKNHTLHWIQKLTSLWQQELRTCKRIGSEIYCKEHFVVKHKSRYRCKSAIYFSLNAEIIKENCNFKFFFNKTDIIPTVLDSGNEIILANWPNDKRIICNINNDILFRIYVNIRNLEHK